MGFAGNYKIGRGRFCDFFCDSRSVLQILECFNPDHPLVIEILEWIFLIKHRGKNVSFCWVPAHVGVRGNEQADNLAKEASVSKTPRNLLVPFRDFIPHIRSAVESLWQFSWDLEGQNKMREVADHLHPWTYYPMPRRRETALCRLRIGHTRLTHGYLMCQDPQPHCSDCIVPLTVRHILIECPSLSDLRNRCFNDRGVRNRNYSLEFIIGQDFNERYLFRFLEEAGILHMI